MITKFSFSYMASRAATELNLTADGSPVDSITSCESRDLARAPISALAGDGRSISIRWPGTSLRTGGQIDITVRSVKSTNLELSGWRVGGAEAYEGTDAAWRDQPTPTRLIGKYHGLTGQSTVTDRMRKFFWNLELNTNATIYARYIGSQGFSLSESEVRTSCIATAIQELRNQINLRRTGRVQQGKISEDHRKYLGELFIKCVDAYFPSYMLIESPTLLEHAFERFSIGDLESIRHHPDISNCIPDGIFYFCFAEFACVMAHQEPASSPWHGLFKLFTRTQDLFLGTYMSDLPGARTFDHYSLAPRQRELTLSEMYSNRKQYEGATMPQLQLSLVKNAMLALADEP